MELSGLRLGAFARASRAGASASWAVESRARRLFSRPAGASPALATALSVFAVDPSPESGFARAMRIS